MGWLEDFLTIGGTLVFILFVFIGAYYATRFIGKKYTVRQSGSGSGKIKMIDQLSLGTDKLLVIVQTGGKTFLLGVTSQHVELLEELDSSLFPQENSVGGEEMSFSAAFQDALKNWKGKTKEKPDQKGGPRL